MTLAAFPGGVAGLKKTDEWRDSVALILGGGSEKPVSIDKIDNPTDDVVQEAVPAVRRALHAKQAERLPVAAWPGPEQGAPQNI